ncbi:MAG: 2-oxoglutarate dehydrogenase E1 component [Alphaproteobacteria bacterium]
MTMLDDAAILLGANSSYLQDLYARFLRDSQSVDESWRAFFADLGDDERALLAEREGASWAPRPTNGEVVVATEARPTTKRAKAPEQHIDAHAIARDSIRILMLIRAYRVRGHLLASLDPLGLEGEKHHPELDPATYGFTESDLDREFFVDGVLGLQSATLRKVLEIVKKTYCRSVGIEFMHIQDPEEKSWIQLRVEKSRNRAPLSDEDKKAILRDLYEAEGFERFLNIKYPGTKRFGLEGAESLIPLLETVIAHASKLGVEDIVLGMPHRGRLNVLTSIMGKSYTKMFSEFQGESANPDEVQGSGDVKYHLGASSDRAMPDGRKMHLSLTANPSHLEAVNPVVLGKVRAKQAQIDDKKRSRVMGLLMHGDAAFAGQGLVAETLGLSELKGYRTGGTIHVIVNNQIGFTTSPKNSRSSPYPSDVAKMVQAPILHVNGDDPEAVVHCAQVAVEFRQRFGRDVVLDMFCYRRHGHNEADEPAFTQPLMYRRIVQHPSTRQLYTEALIASGVLTPKDADRLISEFNAKLEEHLEAAKGYKPNKADWLEGRWAGFEPSDEVGPRRGETAVSLELLREVGGTIARAPKSIEVNRKIVRQLEAKRQAIESGEGIDWATAEAFAFGTLLVEGTNVRLSGQDCCRGTFSQRHAVLVDQKDERRYTPVNHIHKDQAKLEVIDSMLSEAAVLGFEYGYTLSDPETLVLWEAQFGDFVNGAQVIIDQFIAAGESKWLRMCGLVLLLPHGFEGQGPEHSSAKVERFLQLAAEDNIQVANCTTPANYFHVLRRQMRRTFRKPLIVMTPKSLLRHKRCVSRLADMGTGTSFHRVLYEDGAAEPAKGVRRVVLCSGKVFYDLEETRDAAAARDVAILRLEQLAPFPAEPLGEELAKYPGADVVWCQEEPRNMGAWSFVEPHIEETLDRLHHECKRPRFIGRPAAASVATGYHRVHVQEQQALVKEALAA